MSAPSASEIRSPFNASSETSAWSRFDAEPGGDQERAELVAVQPEGAGLVVQLRAADMRGR